jgi:hypothetical protein
VLWHPHINPSDKITTKIFVNRSVFFIFLIPLFGCAFAVLFVGRQNKSWKSHLYQSNSLSALTTLAMMKRELRRATWQL